MDGREREKKNPPPYFQFYNCNQISGMLSPITTQKVLLRG